MLEAAGRQVWIAAERAQAVDRCAAESFDRRRLLDLVAEATALIERVARSTDRADIGIAAHLLKSTFARFGAVRLSRLAAAALESVLAPHGSSPWKIHFCWPARSSD